MRGINDQTRSSEKLRKTINWLKMSIESIFPLFISANTPFNIYLIFLICPTPREGPFSFSVFCSINYFIQKHFFYTSVGPCSCITPPLWPCTLSTPYRVCLPHPLPSLPEYWVETIESIYRKDKILSEINLSK